MRVLIYAGYQSNPFDSNNSNGLGGTEIAIIKIAEELVLFGWKIVISGNVNTSGVIRGVEWINTFDLHQKYHNQFDVIISASYIHFCIEFKEYSRAKRIFWAHNTHHHPWFRGELLENADELVKQVDATVCLTNWHATQWSKAYDINRDNIHVIGNGITPQSFIGTPRKTLGKFIWSSEPSRGLKNLLDNWNKIKKIIPHATLDIYHPGYGAPQIEALADTIQKLDGVTYIGTKSQDILHDAMLNAEYWCYITDYEETYCITALEMQYANVFPITTTTAALNETVKDGIKLELDETNWESAIQYLGRLNADLKKKILNNNKKWVKMQTWSQRSYDWKTLINTVVNGKY